jgi:hypothetical protein
MAKCQYSADSASPPPPVLLFEFPSNVIGSGPTSLPNCGSATAGEAFPPNLSSIGR